MSTSSERICPYSVLGLRRDATNDEIQRAYRRLSLLHHPYRRPHHGSVHKPCEKDEMRFLAISASYDTLMDYAIRRRYDKISKCDEMHNKTIKLQQKHDPLNFMRLARNHAPFSCPYELFNTVFQSDLFNTGGIKLSYSLDSFFTGEPRLTKPSDRLEQHYQTPAFTTYNNSLRSDGKKICKTFKIIHGRRITRTEITSIDPATGIKSTNVEVHWEDNEDNSTRDSFHHKCHNLPLIAKDDSFLSCHKLTKLIFPCVKINSAELE